VATEEAKHISVLWLVTGKPPGAISRFDAAAKVLPRAVFGYSTHAIGLAEAIELARAWTFAALSRGLCDRWEQA
jgi:hypothetical protein